MRNFGRFTGKIVGVIALTITSLTMMRSAQALQTASDTATAEIVTPISIINLAVNGSGLNFGSLIPGTSTGLVVLLPDGSRTSSGGVTLITTAPSTSGQFQVNGTPSTTFIFTLPPSTTITNGINFMTVDTFICNPIGIGTLDSTGKAVVKVGATLHVAASQPVGIYTGTYSVSVAYN